MHKTAHRESLHFMGRSLLLAVLAGGTVLLGSLPFTPFNRPWKVLALLLVWVGAVLCLWTWTSGFRLR